MEEIVQEVKTEKKKFNISDKKLLISLSIFTVITFFAATFLLTFEQNQSQNLSPYKDTLFALRSRKSELDREIGNIKRNLDCSTQEKVESEVKSWTDIYIDYYDEIKDPVVISEICTGCTIREVGIVKYASQDTERFVGLKAFVVRKKFAYEDQEYYSLARILVKDDISEFYMFYNSVEYITQMGEELEAHPLYNNDYEISLETSLLPDSLESDTTIKTTNSYYFKPSSYPSWGREYEDSELQTQIFDTYKDINIYVDKNDSNSYYIKSKEHFLITIDFIPSLSIRADTEPYPITWEEDIKNTFNYDYGYDICGGGGLNIADINKNELKITGYKTGTQQPIYEYADNQHIVLKKIYEEDYIKILYEYDEKREGLTALTYEQFIEHHPVIFWEDETGRMIMFYNERFVITGGCAKPIIYLYPQKDTDITVKVLPTTGYLTFTYPKYNDIWQVRANTKGQLTDTSGNTYDYLWWESKSEYLPTINQGFVVKYNNLNTFFNLILKKAGFVQKEIDDFKEFWIPTMNSEYSPYFKISFLQNEDVNHLAKLLINPKPTTEIRIFMIYERLDSYKEVSPQDIVNTPRKGFVVTEWGGTKR